MHSVWAARTNMATAAAVFVQLYELPTKQQQ